MCNKNLQVQANLYVKNKPTQGSPNIIMDIKVNKDTMNRVSSKKKIILLQNNKYLVLCDRIYVCILIICPKLPTLLSVLCRLK